MTLRTIENRDISACVRIYNRYIMETTWSFEEVPLTEDAFRSRVETIQRKYPFYIAEENGSVIGYAYLSPYNERSAYRYTADLSIYLDWERRGEGIGAKLLQEIETAAKERQIHSILSLVTGENRASLVFHEKNGFIRIGKIEDAGFKMGRWIDLILLQKKIE